MSTQLDLFADSRARHNDPPSSVAAAAKAKRGNGERLRRIAEIVDEAGTWGCIRDEIWARFVLDDPETWTPRRYPTISGAVSRCEDAGLIVPAGLKQSRLSVLGNIQQIYVTPRWKQ